jgi:autotransporter-associated beta strand protein
LTVGSGGIIANGGTIQGGSVLFGSLSSNVPARIYAGSADSGTISSVLSTNQGLVKFGPGKLILSGNNPSLTGAIIISSGTLNIQDAGALGASDGSTGNKATVAAGAALEMQGNLQVGNKLLALNGTGVSGGGALRSLSGTSSWAGEVTIASPAQISVVADALTLSSTLKGDDGLIKTGGGTLVLSANNSSAFNGSITITEGTLKMQNAGALGASGAASGTTVQSGATLAIEGGTFNLSEPLTVSGPGVANAGAIHSLSGTNSLSGTVALVGDAWVKVDAGSLDLSGCVGDPTGKLGAPFAVTKAGPGNLSLSSSLNNFSGPLSVLGGTLKVASLNDAGAAGPLGTGLSPVVLGSSATTATLEYTGSTASSTRAFTLAANGTGVFQIDGSATVTLSSPIDGTGLFQKTGPGTLTLTAANDYIGATAANAGTLKLSGPTGAIASPSIAVNPNGILTLYNSASDNGNPDRIGGSAVINLNGGTLNFSNDGTSANFSETVGALAVASGASTVNGGLAASGKTSTLTFSAISRTIGATVAFAGTNLGTSTQNAITIAGQPNGFIGAWAVSGNNASSCNDWAKYGQIDSTGVYSITPFVAGDYTSHTEANWASGDHVKLTSGIALTASRTISTLNISAAATLNIPDGATLRIQGSSTGDNVGGLLMSGSSQISIAPSGTTGALAAGQPNQSAELVVHQNATADATISAVITDNGTGHPVTVTKSGPGKLKLTGQNSFTGDTYVNQGTLEYVPPNDLSYGGALHGVGNVAKSGTAKLTLTGDSSKFAGSTTVTGGSLCVNGSLGDPKAATLSLQSGAQLAGTGTVGGNVSVDGAVGGTIAFGTLAGKITGNVTVNNNGTLTVGQSGVGNYLSADGSVNVTGTSIISAATGGQLVASLNYTSSANDTFSGVISGTGKTVTLNSPSTTLTLSGANSYTGGTTIQAGTLKMGNVNALGDQYKGGLTLSSAADNAKLDLNGFSLTLPSLSASGLHNILNTPTGSTLTISGLLSSASSSTLIKTGPGTLIIAGPQSWGAGSVLQIGGSGGGFAPQQIMSLGGGLDNLTAGSGYGAGFAPAGNGVPEPSSWALILVGGATLAGWGVLRFRWRLLVAIVDVRRQ